MAKRYLTSIDLSKNQIINVSVHNLATPPSTPVVGQMYFNTVSNRMYFYDGSIWVDMTGTIQNIIGGAGLSVSFVNAIATLDVNVDNATLEINSDSIRVKDLGITSAKINDGAVTTVKIEGNGVTLNKLQQIGSYTALGNVTGVQANVSQVVIVTDLANASSVSLATSSAIKSYVDTAIGGIGNLEGAWDASTGSFPIGSSPVSGTKKGDYWYATVAGTAGGVNFNIGDVIIAKVDTASVSLASDWIQLEVNREQATTTVLGLVQLATSTEVNTGTDTSKVVTPSTLSARTATETRTGLAEIATQDEVNTGTDDLRIVTPLKLKTYLAANTSGSYAADLTGSATSYTITHNLASKDVVIEVYENATGETVYTDVVRTSTNVVTIGFATAPASNEYRVVIKK